MRYPEPGYTWLACHAAFPLALTSDLLYKIWLNFRQDEYGDSLDIPLDAVPAVLNSSLCRRIGRDTYEIHESLRLAFRQHLQDQDNLGLRRMKRLARFLLSYLEYCKHRIPSQAFEEAQRWMVDAYLQPARAAERLLGIFSEEMQKTGSSGGVEIYLSWVNKQQKQAPGGQGADAWAMAEAIIKGVQHMQEGNREKASQVLEALKPFVREPETDSGKGFKARVPPEVLQLLRGEDRQEAQAEEQGTVFVLLATVGKTASGQAQELAGPANDLQLVREQLPILLEGRRLEVNVLADEQATKAAVLEQWRNMVEQAQPEDHLLFYFSGHAVNKDAHYLILYDYQEQRMSKVESIRTVTGGAIYDREFREASAGCRGYITLVLDTHAGGEGWLDLENDKNVILSATLPGQTAYEQRFGELAHGLFSKALLEALGAGRYRTHKWVIRKAAEWMKSSFDMPQYPLVLGSQSACRRPMLGQGVSDRPNIDFLLDLLKANGHLSRQPGQTLSVVIETCWDSFASEFSLPGVVDFSKPEDMARAIGHLEKALLFKGQGGLSIAVPGKSDAERELFQLELSLEERLGIPIHINRKKKGDGDPATR